LKTNELPPKRHVLSYGRTFKSVSGTKEQNLKASSSRDRSQPVPKVSAMDLLRQLKISDNGPIVAVIQPTSGKGASPYVAEASTVPKPPASPSKSMNAVADPSTLRMPPLVVPCTPSNQHVGECSVNWVLGWKHYQEAQIKADHSLDPVVEEDDPLFISEI
jgi:hypothetical protein